MCGVPAVRDSLQRSTIARHALGVGSEACGGRCDPAARSSCDTLHRRGAEPAAWSFAHEHLVGTTNTCHVPMLCTASMPQGLQGVPLVTLSCAAPHLIHTVFSG